MVASQMRRLIWLERLRQLERLRELEPRRRSVVGGVLVKDRMVLKSVFRSVVYLGQCKRKWSVDSGVLGQCGQLLVGSSLLLS